MNDTQLSEAVKSRLTEVHDSLSTVHLAIPASEIAARAHKRIRRRHQTVLAGAAGIAASAAIAAVALLPGSGTHHGGTGTAQLAAWTVAKQADGNISVTLRELRDPAGLQRTLRADGVPASVTFGGHQNPACRPYPASTTRLSMVFQRPAPAWPGPHRKIFAPGHRFPLPDLRITVIVIHPSALPDGTGVQLAANELPRQHDRPAVKVPVFNALDLVYASPQCTGS
jgi:hypothetical protein